jgi:sugar phosphate permease
MTVAGDLPDPLRPARGTTRHWMVLAGAAMLMVGAVFIFLSFSLVNPPLARELGVGLSQVMVYNSIMALTGAVSMTTVGPWAVRTLGPRRTVIIGGALTAMALFAISFTTSLVMLYLIAAALGLAFGISTNMMASVLVSNWFSTSRGTILGAMFAVARLGGVAMGFVMPHVVDSGGFPAGFRLLAGLIAVLTIGSGIFLIRSHPADVGLLPRGAIPVDVREESTPASVEVPGVPRARAVRSPQFVALLTAIVLVTSVHAVQQHFAPLLTERGVNLAAAGSLLSLLAFVGIFGTLTVGTLNDRAGTRTAVLFALGSQFASMGLFLVASGYLPLAAGITVFALGSSLPLVLVPILVMVLFGPRDYAAILGPVMAAGPVGIAIGTPLWGLSVDVTGSYDAGLWVAIGATVAAAVLLVWSIRTAPAFRERVARELDQGPGEATA